MNIYLYPICFTKQQLQYINLKYFRYATESMCLQTRLCFTSFGRSVLKVWSYTTLLCYPIELFNSQLSNPACKDAERIPKTSHQLRNLLSLKHVSVL